MERNILNKGKILYFIKIDNLCTTLQSLKKRRNYRRSITPRRLRKKIRLTLSSDQRRPEWYRRHPSDQVHQRDPLDSHISTPSCSDPGVLDSPHLLFPHMARIYPFELLSVPIDASVTRQLNRYVHRRNLESVHPYLVWIRCPLGCRDLHGRDRCRV